MELNPNHPVSQAVREHWHKFCALLLHKAGVNEVVITAHDIDSLPPDCAIAVEERNDGLHLRLVGRAEAKILVAKEGGQPH